MYIEQLYTNCLAQAAYYIESNGEAAIIDPLREVQPYLDLAQKRGAKIKYIFETHFHADFVSGHIDLAKNTGAKIIYGPGANAEYDIYVAHNKEQFPLGNIVLELWHTPGHTMESSCILLKDEAAQPHAIFTGDTLFVGDVGRPDLAVASTITKEDLAGFLFESLKELKTLPNDVVLYPGHGPGSACGKNIGKETQSTLGSQKELNYAMRITNKSEFITALTDGLTAPPAYFFADAKINKTGYDNIETVLDRNTIPLTQTEIEALVAQGAWILDTRPADDYVTKHITNSINIGLNGSYAVWVGAILPIDKPLVVIAEPGREREAILRLARVGYENVKGYLNGGIDAWNGSTRFPEVEPSEFANSYSNQTILDVRNPAEYHALHIQGAKLIPLTDLPNSTNQLDKNTTYYVHCAGGYRSLAATTWLAKNGYKVVNMRGGMNRIQETKLPLVKETVAV